MFLFTNFWVGRIERRFASATRSSGALTRRRRKKNVERVGRIMEKYGFDLFRFYPGRHVEGAAIFLKGVRDTYGDRVKFKSLDLSGGYEPDDAICGH